MKKVTIIVVVLAIIIGIYFYSKTTKRVPVEPKISEIAVSYASSTPISLIDFSAHQARFKPSILLNPKDITAVNVRPCIAETSTTGTSVPCQPPNKFKVSLDADGATIVISEINIDAKNKDTFGIFKSGCALCTHLVSFENLHTTDGTLLAPITVTVR